MTDIERDAYTSESLSAHFRRMYDIGNSVPVFDNIQEIDANAEAIYKPIGKLKEGKRFWVHVVNTPETWKHEVELDQGFVFPPGFNNVVDVVPRWADPQRLIVYMHFRPCADGLPEDF